MIFSIWKVGEIDQSEFRTLEKFKKTCRAPGEKQRQVD
jgi:hypothetical protein